MLNSYQAIMIYNEKYLELDTLTLDQYFLDMSLKKCVLHTHHRCWYPHALQGVLGPADPGSVVSDPKSTHLLTMYVL